jgi:hypothetical protein
VAEVPVILVLTAVLVSAGAMVGRRPTGEGDPDAEGEETEEQELEEGGGNGAEMEESGDEKANGKSSAERKRANRLPQPGRSQSEESEEQGEEE